MIEDDENKETVDIRKELDEIDKKFDEARGIKFEVNCQNCDHKDLSSKNLLTMQICKKKQAGTCISCEGT